MAKITVHGGPSVGGASVVAGGWSSEGDPDVWPEPGEGGEVVEPLPEPAADVEPDSTESAVESSYEAWTVEQLRAELDSRGLPKAGKKDELVLRLSEDDDARKTEPASEAE